MSAEPDRVFVEGIEFYAYHGVSAEERRVGHRFTADVSLWLDVRPAALDDDLAKTVDYGLVAQTLVDEACRTPYRLVETLTERLAQQLLKLDGCNRVRLRVAKLNPPMPTPARLAGVEIERCRPAGGAGGADRS
ncbi:MAG: dihydroneopterin aldolase [Armatimonadetes bacterium]|nr:dihydroneopterin aldolase [Armatimonadota bacterium]